MPKEKDKKETPEEYLKRVIPEIREYAECWKYKASTMLKALATLREHKQILIVNGEYKGTLEYEKLMSHPLSFNCTLGGFSRVNQTSGLNLDVTVKRYTVEGMTVTRNDKKTAHILAWLITLK